MTNRILAVDTGVFIKTGQAILFGFNGKYSAHNLAVRPDHKIVVGSNGKRSTTSKYVR